MLKNNLDLVQHCKKALKEGWAYTWSTFGQTLTFSLLKNLQQRYPEEINRYYDYIINNNMNKINVDCSGLIKSYLFEWRNNNPVYNSQFDLSAEMVINRAKVKGKISTIPETLGLCVYFKGHIGVYIGNGEVIEARGTKYGVVKTKLNERPWTDWCEHPYIQYINNMNDLTGYSTIRMYDSTIHIYETNIDNEDVDVTLGEEGKLEKLSDITESDKNITAKINGGFFNFDGSKEHLGLFIDEGKKLNNYDNTFITFTYYKDNSTKIHYIQKDEDVKQLLENAKWSIGAGWSLVKDGKIDLTNANVFDISLQRHPRTLLGQKKDGSFIFVVVDGRTSTNAGVTAQQSGEIMLKLGCWNAVSLDGGGSSEMIVDGKIKNNLPEGERYIGSAVIAYRTDIDNVKNKSEVVDMLLRKGSIGEDVKELQSNLNKIGYNLVVDGIFGQKTEIAVIDFQKKYNLKVDGVVGNETSNAIDNALKTKDIDLERALKILSNKKIPNINDVIINTPEYWINAIGEGSVKADYVRELIIKVVKYLDSV